MLGDGNLYLLRPEAISPNEERRAKITFFPARQDDLSLRVHFLACEELEVAKVRHDSVDYEALRVLLEGIHTIRRSLLKMSDHLGHVALDLHAVGLLVILDLTKIVDLDEVNKFSGIRVVLISDLRGLHFVDDIVNKLGLEGVRKELIVGNNVAVDDHRRRSLNEEAKTIKI